MITYNASRLMQARHHASDSRLLGAQARNTSDLLAGLTEIAIRVRSFLVAGWSGIRRTGPVRPPHVAVRVVAGSHGACEAR